MENITNLSQLDWNGSYTYSDYLTWRFEETVELIKGKLMKMAAPSRRHQQVSWRLSGVFFNVFRQSQCEVYAAPFDVRLLDNQKSLATQQMIYSVVQPDLCVICDPSKLDDKGCEGAPDLIIEILSAGNSKKEMRIKKNLYEENGVREYWVIDPEHETLIQYVLIDKTFASPQIFVSDDKIQSAIFPNLHFILAEIF